MLNIVNILISDHFTYISHKHFLDPGVLTEACQFVAVPHAAQPDLYAFRGCVMFQSVQIYKVSVSSVSHHWPCLKL